MSAPLDDDQLQKIYAWVDEIPLSRPKRNITRDFSDGVMMAEVVAHYFPRLVEMHNYSPANSVRQKLYNWATLNQKVFKKLGFAVAKPDIDAVVNCKPGVVESVLYQLQSKMAAYRARKAAGGGPHTARSARSRGAGSARGAPRGGGGDGAVGGGREAAPYDAPAGGGAGSGGDAGAAHQDHAALQKEVDEEILVEKEQTIQELRETVEILELKIKKLEQLVRLKDSRIQTLTARLQSKQLGI